MLKEIKDFLRVAKLAKTPINLKLEGAKNVAHEFERIYKIPYVVLDTGEYPVWSKYAADKNKRKYVYCTDEVAI